MSTETKVLTGISVVTIVLVVGAALMLGGKSTPEKAAPPADSKVLVRADSHKSGAKNAKVTIVEFGDFQCPACGAAHPIVKQITEEYKDRVTFVFRNYPLSMHQNSKLAAEAAEAAGAQGKYFEMHDMLYDKQKDWGESPKAKDKIMQYAQDLKLDMDKFKSDVEANKYDKKIQQDIADGNSAQVEATPTFYINGVKNTGGLPYNDFKKKLDEALKSAK
jgi:protein-disulfide isomerase